MAAYIRSKITNSDFTDVTIEAKDSNAKVRQDGTFKLPVASGINAETPVGSIRYNDVLQKIQFKTDTGWKVIDAITDGLATEQYVNNAINNLAPVARSGNFDDLYNKPNTLAGYGIIDDVASKYYVNEAISSLLGGAPTFLDTLNEIANAINNDPDFSNNVVTQLSNKLNLSGGTLTGPLYLSGPPGAANQAATKAYVDSVTSGIVIYNTDDLPEGSTNLYYTNARATAAAKNAISAGTGVSYNSGTGVVSIGQNVSTSSNVTFNTVTANEFNIEATGDYTVTSATNIVLDAGMEVLVRSPLTLASYTTTQLDDLLVQNGTIAFDSVTGTLKIYTSLGWTEVVGGGGFSGDYNDLINKPVLFSGSYNDLTNKPTIPTNTNQLINGAGFITSSSLTWSNITGKPVFATVATSGSYTDLTNKPDLTTKLNLSGGAMTGALILNGAPIIPNQAATKQYVDDNIPYSILDLGIEDGTDGQVLTTDGAGNFTFKTVSGTGGGGASTWSDISFEGGGFTDPPAEYSDEEVILDGGLLDVDYNSIINPPNIPTALSQLTNDVGFLTSETDSQTLSLVGNQLSISNGNTITLPSTVADYNDLANLPDLSVYQLASSAFSGNYNDLTNTPAIPSKVSDLTNDSGFLTGVTWTQVSGKPTIPSKVSDLTNDVGYMSSVDWSDIISKPSFATVATSGSYNDLSNKPTIPTDVGDLTDTGSLLSGTASILVSTNATGDEGGEVQLAKPPNATLNGGIVFDAYQNRLRIFENGGDYRGIHIDLTKAPAGVAGELMWKKTAFVNAGTFVTMDNLKVSVTTSGARGLSIGAVSTNFTANVSGWFGYTGGGGGASAYNVAYTTTASGSAFGWSFGTEGDTAQYNILDRTNSRMYRVTMMIGGGYINNFICIERLI